MQTKPENGLAFSGKYFKVAKSGLDAGQGHRIRSRHSVKTIVDSLTVLTGPKGLTAPASVRVKYPVIPIFMPISVGGSQRHCLGDKHPDP